MSISILVVDDNRPIAEGFSGKFRRYAEQHFQIAAEVEVLCSSDDAVRRISDDSKPPFDLLFTDIDLSDEGPPDKAGVAFARYARAKTPGVPIVGYSGRFEDLTEDDMNLFDNWWSKGGSSGKLNEIAEDALERAIAHQRSRRSSLASVHNDHNQIAGDACEGGPVMTPQTDQEFSMAGYSKNIIEPSESNDVAEPFAVWVRASDEGVELEVVGCSALFTWGDTYEEAEAGLVELIQEMKKTIQEPDESFSPSLLNAKRFVQTVTGSRTAQGAA